jgi:hypothetical protein
MPPRHPRFFGALRRPYNSPQLPRLNSFDQLTNEFFSHILSLLCQLVI